VPGAATRLTLEELKKIHLEKRQEIRDRLNEFERVGRTGSPQQLFEELAFCILTAGASARMGLRSVEGIRPYLMSGSARDLKRALAGRHRFANSRGTYLYETREYLREACGLKLRRALKSFESPDERRDFLAANRGVRGIGYKEASHFLRNVGFRGYAILDKHLLSRLAEFGVIESPKPPSTKAKYLAIEEKLRNFSDSIGIDFDELDLLLWYTKTGEILK
jgi:N-glycosylase/DNA lyase